MSKTYVKKDIDQCLSNTRILYIGDSIMREQYYTMTQFLHFNKPTVEAIHTDQKVHTKDSNITVEMWWDPYLNSTKTINLLEANVPEHEKPSLLIIGSGIWYMRRLRNQYLSGWKTAVDRIFDGAIKNRIADKVLISPVEIVEYDLMIPARKATLTYDKITIMNNYLRERESQLRRQSSAVTPLAVPFVWNEIVTTSKNQTVDGLHFKTPVTRAEAQLALNYRCNQQLALEKSTPAFPNDSTCCYSYPTPVWYQSAVFLFFLGFVPLGVFLHYTTSGKFPILRLFRIRKIFPSTFEVLSALFIFGLSVIYMYFGDRTQLFGKMFKQFDASGFWIMIAAMLLLGLVTLKTKNNKEDSNNDAGFLNRDQTEEWKGWMQLVILIYHFTGASRIAAIYNPVRILVASYLFQTGYGHFHFFYKKADFGIARIMNIMVRLNLLTYVLAYLMKTDYLFYYFSPLVSFWFAVIWITMRIMPSYNQKAWFILSKIAIMSIMTGIIIHYPGVLEATFSALHWLFKINWNVTEWRFRLSLDAWIVYIGMLCAYASIKLSELNVCTSYPRPWAFVKYAALAASTVGLVWYFIFELQHSKLSYTPYHPYISWIPILSFVVIRNFNCFARNVHSRFFSFIGKISLETFIGQFHMWLAADTKGLLVVLPHASWAIKTSFGWWTNLVISSIIFVFICYYLSQATSIITRWICSGATEQQKRQQKATSSTQGIPANAIKAALPADTLPLLPTSSSSSSSFVESPISPISEKKAQSIPLKSAISSESMDCRLSEESSIDIEDPWEASTYDIRSKPAWYKTLYESLSQNYWVKCTLCLVLMGAVNRLAA
ncbi:10 TM acyl transferase domain found in Cas1p-domain-containing protein [Mycotypha africana]|uniref:10 TM acyl transferase domain found in Cas1p-domain-containing protein n=1 Tax=Mycotypha africana TaxID=64632 RepID=UPI0023012471|nr:10 TM acyl transferase domain found in Cas1p-domain-containing protein [Mycotypha africana]KAI8988472.1 10 TM acyl transferase domain found in Cas1p-domain-containing protein [Mycotypha africana]